MIGEVPLMSTCARHPILDQILRGEKPGDLAVQQPTRIEFALNLKTAQTLGIDIPPNILVIADQVIE
jgi:putative tryptophan/tyrosine transport system substrate-binding protein